jgi:hypothetical protein
LYNINLKDDFYEQMKHKQWKISDTNWKRIRDITEHFGFSVNKSTSRKIKDYFIKQNVKIDEDDKNGHKIFIEYL